MPPPDNYPLNGISTAEDRQVALDVLKGKFLSKEFSNFPPDAIETIETIDAMNEENPHALDLFFLDSDIVDIIKEQVAESDLTSEFFHNYADCAKKLWSGIYYPNFARELGFP